MEQFRKKIPREPCPEQSLWNVLVARVGLAPPAELQATERSPLGTGVCAGVVLTLLELDKDWNLYRCWKQDLWGLRDLFGSSKKWVWVCV